jgi:hypothetical protein
VRWIQNTTPTYGSRLSRRMRLPLRLQLQLLLLMLLLLVLLVLLVLLRTRFWRKGTSYQNQLVNSSFHDVVRVATHLAQHSPPSPESALPSDRNGVYQGHHR